MITHVKFVTLPVRDQDEALAFWIEKAGLRLLTDQPMGEHRWIELGIGDSPTRLVLFPAQENESADTPFAASLACDDVEATYRQLSARGVEFTQAPKKEHWGEYAVFNDSDGNSIMLSSR